MAARLSASLFPDRRFPDRLAIRRTCGPGWVAMLSLPLFPLAACGENGTGPSDPGDGPVPRGTVHAVGGESSDGLWAVWRTTDGSVHDRDLGNWAEDGRFTAFRERHIPLSAGTLVAGKVEPPRLALVLEIPETLMPSVMAKRRLLLGLPALPGLQGDGR